MGKREKCNKISVYLIKEDIDKHNDRLLEIENLNLIECLSNQQERIESLESTMSIVKGKNEWLKKTLFWYQIFVPISVVLAIIRFFIR